MDLAEIIAKLEAAPGPDSVLNAEIACAVKFKHLRPAAPGDFAGEYGYHPGSIKTEHGFLQAEHYTSSLDAAMTLVLESGWTVHSQHPDPKHRERRDSQGPCALVYGGLGHRPWSFGATPAIALCIAALKARLSQAV